MTKSSTGKTSERERLARFEAKQDYELVKRFRQKKDNRISIIVATGAVVLAIGSQLTYGALVPDPVAEVPVVTDTPSLKPIPDIAIAENRVWSGTMQVGDASLEIELDGALAPQAVASFIDNANDGFFTGITCHRLTTSGIFVLQCGRSSETVDGGPGYTFGPIENAPTDNLYLEGTLAMARVGSGVIGPEAAGTSMGSQFFIVYQDSTINADLAGGYTVFGKITSGLDGLAPVIEAGVEGGGSDGVPVLETKLGAIELR